MLCYEYDTYLQIDNIRLQFVFVPWIKVTPYTTCTTWLDARLLTRFSLNNRKDLCA